LNSGLDVRDVSKAFDGIVAVNALSITFPDKRVNALVGPNGAGKTTLFNLVTGFERPDKGEITWRGIRLDQLKPAEIARRGVGRLFQDLRLFKKLTVSENLALAASNGSTTVTGSFLNRRENEYTASEEKWLARFELLDKRSLRAEALSYGQQKLLALARVLISDRSAVLLDEPISGLSTKMVDITLGVISELVDAGKTVVMIEHTLDIVSNMTSWTYFLASGRLVAEGPTATVLKDPSVRRIYLSV
jgi:neutral amino acid transport system ATP-binding protein